MSVSTIPLSTEAYAHIIINIILITWKCCAIFVVKSQDNIWCGMCVPVICFKRLMGHMSRAHEKWSSRQWMSKPSNWLYLCISKFALTEKRERFFLPLHYYCCCFWCERLCVSLRFDFESHSSTRTKHKRRTQIYYKLHLDYASLWHTIDAKTISWINK